MAQLWQNRWFRISTYSSFFSLAFLVSLVLTYPSAALVAEIESGIAKGAPDIKNLVIEDASISGLGLRLDHVEFTYGKGEIPWRFDQLHIGLAGFGFDPENPAFHLSAIAYGGQLDLQVDGATVSAQLEDLDLSAVLPIQDMLGIGMGGRLAGNLNMDVSDPKQKWRKADGAIDLMLSGASIGPGKLPIPGFGQALTVPEVRIGDLPLGLEVKEGKATLAPIKATGEQLELAAKGEVTLQRSLRLSALDLSVDARPTEKLKSTQEGKNLLNVLDRKSPLLPKRVKRNMSKKGWLGMTVSGRLSRPRFRMRKSNVR